MTLIVSISELRNNISGYLEKVLKGARVFIRDEKRGVTVAQMVQTSSFNKDDYERVLQKAAGVFSKENHPEWGTKDQVIKWVKKGRLSDERSF